jgi:hypothetical protein
LTNQFSLAVSSVLFPSACIWWTIWPYHSTNAISHTSFPLAYISRSCLKNILPPTFKVLSILFNFLSLTLWEIGWVLKFYISSTSGTEIRVAVTTVMKPIFKFLFTAIAANISTLIRIGVAPLHYVTLVTPCLLLPPLLLFLFQFKFFYIFVIFGFVFIFILLLFLFLLLVLLNILHFISDWQFLRHETPRIPQPHLIFLHLNGVWIVV